MGELPHILPPSPAPPPKGEGNRTGLGSPVVPPSAHHVRCIVKMGASPYAAPRRMTSSFESAAFIRLFLLLFLFSFSDSGTGTGSGTGTDSGSGTDSSSGTGSGTVTGSGSGSGTGSVSGCFACFACFEKAYAFETYNSPKSEKRLSCDEISLFRMVFGMLLIVQIDTTSAHSAIVTDGQMRTTPVFPRFPPSFHCGSVWKSPQGAPGSVRRLRRTAIILQ